jgi:predicted Zn-dependent protease
LFKQLANAYSKIDDEGRSLLALAEFNLLIGKKEKCTKYAKEAKEKLNKSFLYL